jgi:hypothetical protein
VGGLALPGNALAVDVVDGIAYVCADSSGLQIVDVSEPVQPVLLGELSSSGAIDVSVEDGMAYVADWDEGFLVIDVTDPARRRCGTSPTLGSSTRACRRVGNSSTWPRGNLG